METAIAISPLEFTKEFAGALKGAKPLTGLENLTIGPGATHRTDDATFAGTMIAGRTASGCAAAESDLLDGLMFEHDGLGLGMSARLA